MGGVIGELLPSRGCCCSVMHDIIVVLCFLSCIEIQSNSSDFAKGYKELVKVRVNLKKAGETYDKKMQAYSNSLASYFVVEEELKALKKSLEEVSELRNECVSSK